MPTAVIYFLRSSNNNRKSIVSSRKMMHIAQLERNKAMISIMKIHNVSNIKDTIKNGKSDSQFKTGKLNEPLYTIKNMSLKE